jgi:hypothetical protein
MGAIHRRRLDPSRIRSVSVAVLKAQRLAASPMQSRGGGVLAVELGDVGRRWVTVYRDCVPCRRRRWRDGGFAGQRGSPSLS